MNSYQIYDLLNFLMVILFILGFVFIVLWFKKKESDKKTQVIMAALENGQTLDHALFSSNKKTKNKYILLGLLAGGCGMTLFAVIITILCIVDDCVNGRLYIEHYLPCTIFTAIGVGLLIAYFYGKKILKPELDQEAADSKK